MNEHLLFYITEIYIEMILKQTQTHQKNKNKKTVSTGSPWNSRKSRTLFGRQVIMRHVSCEAGIKLKC